MTFRLNTHDEMYILKVLKSFYVVHFTRRDFFCVCLFSPLSIFLVFLVNVLSEFPLRNGTKFLHIRHVKNIKKLKIFTHFESQVSRDYEMDYKFYHDLLPRSYVPPSTHPLLVVIMRHRLDLMNLFGRIHFHHRLYLSSYFPTQIISP
jgi:hypothetical protein